MCCSTSMVLYLTVSHQHFASKGLERQLCQWYWGGKNQGEIYEHNNESFACFNYNNPGLFEVCFCSWKSFALCPLCWTDEHGLSVKYACSWDFCVSLNLSVLLLTKWAKGANYQLCLHVYHRANLLFTLTFCKTHCTILWMVFECQPSIVRGSKKCTDAFHPRCLWCTCPHRMSSAVPNWAKQGKWIKISAKAAVWQFHLCFARHSLSHAQIKSLIYGSIKEDLSAPSRLELVSHNTHTIPRWCWHGGGLRSVRHLRLIVTAWGVDDSCFLILHLNRISIFSQ